MEEFNFLDNSPHVEKELMVMMMVRIMIMMMIHVDQPHPLVVHK